MELYRSNVRVSIVDGILGSAKKNIEYQENLILDALKEEIRERVSKVNQFKTLDENIKTEELKWLKGNNFELKYPIKNNEITKFTQKNQKWIGHVLEIKEEHFISKLIDLNNNTTYEIGEFDLDEVSPEDKELLTVGATFYWSLGHTNFNGQIEKKSIIRFQRVRLWKETDYDRVIDRANELYENLKWE